jgi:hypothetical protein
MRTVRNWFDKIADYHLARVSNGPPRPQQPGQADHPGTALRRQTEPGMLGSIVVR